MADDERIARLQRLAYGAGTPDDVRVRAREELAELAAMAEAAAKAEAAEAERLHAPERRAPRRPGHGATGSEPDTVRGGTRQRKRMALVGAAGLVAGAALGVAIGLAIPSGPVVDDPAPNAPAFGSGEPDTPLAETVLPSLFEKLLPVTDPGEVARAVPGIDPLTVRLVATRTDGPAAYLARTAESGDVCLAVLFPDGSTASRCTSSGRLPAGGLRVDSASPAHPSVAAILTAAGIVTLGFGPDG